MRLTKVLKFLGLVLISLLVLGLYLGVSGVLAGEYLTEVLGSDTPAFIDRVAELKESFPRYAFWNPQEGGGVGLTDVYPILVPTVIIFLSKITSLGIVAWTKILGFLSISLFAFGIYLFVISRLKVWVIGFLAGLFYILSPIAYIWLFEWGFYAESVSMIWFPLILLFFDLWLDRQVKGREGFKTRFYFCLTGALLALTLLSHPMVFFGALMFMGLYGLAVVLMSKKEKRLRLKRLLTGGLKLLFVVLILSSFWLVPFDVYRRLASEGRLYGAGSAEGIYRNDIDLKNVLSFYIPDSIEEKAFMFRHFSFPLALAWLLPLGLLMVLVFKKKRLSLAFGVAGLMLWMALSPAVLVFFDRLPLLVQFNNWRILMYPARVLVPVAAAWGIYGLVYWLIFPFKFIERRWWLRGLRNMLVTGLVLVIASGWLWYWRNKPGDKVDRIRYGREISECNLWRAYQEDFCKRQVKMGIEAQLKDVEQWQRLLSGAVQEEVIEPEVERFMAAIPGGDFWRLFVTPHGGWVRALAPILTKNTVMHNYDMLYSVLNTNLYAVQEENLGFWKSDVTYADRRAASEFTQWYGIKYYVLNEATDPVEELKQVGLKEVARLKTSRLAGDLMLFEFEQAEPIVSVDSRPRILVVGRDDSKFRMYELAFRKALFNIVPYDRAMLIHGEKYLSDYSLEELKQFEAVWLFGYDYKDKQSQTRDREKTWVLLDRYIKEGGRLFLDTGWQYTAADWQRTETAEFFPTKNLSWQDLGMTSNYELKPGLVDVAGIDLAKFKPLIWEDQGWAVSTSNDLRGWAKPILLAKGMPLVAGGNYGAGRVVWSGMNILNHIEGFDWGNEEAKLVKRIVEWLVAGYEGEKLGFAKDYVARRVTQDKVELEFKKGIGDGYGLYFKEAWHPYWRAKLVSGNKQEKLKIYKAGPDFKYVFLPEVEVGDKLVLYVKLPWWYKSLRLVSGIGLVWLLVYVFKPKWLAFSWPKKWRFGGLKKWWEDEEEG